MKLRRLGTKYGGWVIPIDLLGKDSICYCAGAGEDISFDIALTEEYLCEVYSFDPTPRAIQHVAKLREDVSKGRSTPINHDPATLYSVKPERLKRFHFFDVGVNGEDGKQRFYAPKNSADVSHSILNLQETEEFFEAQCKSIPTLMQELGHSRIDLLKLDVEGAEYEIRDSLFWNDIKPRVLCVEFDEANMKMKIDRAVSYIKKLQDNGYSMADSERWNFTFVRCAKLKFPRRLWVWMKYQAWRHIGGKLKKAKRLFMHTS